MSFYFLAHLIKDQMRSITANVIDVKPHFQKKKIL